MGADAALHSEAALNSGSAPACPTPTTALAPTVGPVRTCIGCRTRSSADGLVRVVVPDFQLSLAIGKEGQNARLAARLTGWRIDIRSDEAPAPE